MRWTETWAAALIASGLAASSVAQTGPVEGVAESRGQPAEGVVVYLEPRGAVEEPVVASPLPVIDQNHLAFLPSLVVVPAGTKVDFLNSDPILHNVFSPGWSGEAFDLGTYPSGMTRSHTFSVPGPHVILCKVHPEMAAYVFVVTTPYYGVTDTGGRFAIEGVPPGRYLLTVWRRGHPFRTQDVVVPAGGLRGLALNLEGAGELVRDGWDAPR